MFNDPAYWYARLLQVPKFTEQLEWSSRAKYAAFQELNF
jgi:hypothetical protein